MCTVKAEDAVEKSQQEAKRHAWQSERIRELRKPAASAGPKRLDQDGGQRHKERDSSAARYSHLTYRAAGSRSPEQPGARQSYEALAEVPLPGVHRGADRACGSAARSGRNRRHGDLRDGCAGHESDRAYL